MSKLRNSKKYLWKELFLIFVSFCFMVSVCNSYSSFNVYAVEQDTAGELELIEDTNTIPPIEPQPPYNIDLEQTGVEDKNESHIWLYVGIGVGVVAVAVGAVFVVKAIKRRNEW